ncbi:MAG: hypothetical protein FJY67_02865 [Calditrichaeota bacterium]|nr:hypothetical protein [Calditrichota bacterium]
MRRLSALIRRFPNRITGSLILLSALILQCKEEGSFNPVGPPVRRMFVAGLTVEPSRLAPGGEARLRGSLVDQFGAAFGGIVVSFNASQGTITAADTTDANGRFEGRYFAGERSGTDSIFIAAADLREMLTVEILPPSSDLTMRIGRPSILASGFDTTRIVIDVTSRSDSIARIPIRIDLSAGTINGEASTVVATDAQGRATTILTSPSSAQGLTGTITASFATGSGMPPEGDDRRALTHQQSTNVKDAALRHDSSRHLSIVASADSAESRRTIDFRGVSISITTADTLIPGDGQATARLVAVVKEENLRAVAESPVTFSALYGTIAGSVETDESGVARATLTAARRPGLTDRIVARYGPLLADTTLVRYAEAVGRIDLTAGQTILRGDGQRGTTLTARVFGGTGRPAPGIEVEFTASTGTLTGSRAVTDDNGAASVNYIAPARIEDTTAVIRAIAASPTLMPGARGPAALVDRQTAHHLSESPPTDASHVLMRSTPSTQFSVASSDETSDTLHLLIRGLTLRVTASPDSLVARRGSTAEITAQLHETRSGNPVSGDTIRFSALLGQVPATGILDANGTTSVTFTAAGETGSALVTARYALAHRDSTALELLPLIGGLTIALDPPSILAGGIGSSRVTATVTDPRGGVVARAEVWFGIGDQPPDSVRVLTDSTGRAFVVISSPPVEEDSSLRIFASAGSLRRSADLDIRSIERRMTASPDSLSAGSATPAIVTCEAVERRGRRPVVGDTVWFSARSGVIRPFALLDSSGRARTTFTAGGETGTAVVYGQLGFLAPDSTHIELIPALARVSVSPSRRSLLANGLDTTRIVVFASNLLGQPAPEVVIVLEADAGSIAPSSGRTGIDGIFTALYTGIGLPADSIVRIRATATSERVSELASERGLSEREDAGIVSIDSEQPSQPPPSSLTRLPAYSLTISRSISTTVQPYRPATLEPDEVVDSTSVTLRGVRLAVRTSPRALYADGRSRAGVAVQLNETTTGAAIGSARLRIGASLGAIQAEGTTRADGTYLDSLTTGVINGTSRVQVFYGEGLTAADSVLFLPDPARLSIVMTPDRNELPADGRSTLRLTSLVTDPAGQPVSGVSVRFTQESPVVILLDPAEASNVVRWESSFRIDDPDAVTGLRFQAQLRGIDLPGTQVHINRQPLDQVALPRSRLWSDYTLNLPTDQVAAGVNRIEIIGAVEGGATDRFSIAGVRLGALQSTQLGIGQTDERGMATLDWTAGRATGTALLRASLADQPARFHQRTIRLEPRGPAFIRFGASAETLFASGSETADFLALAADSNGNPVADGHRIAFTLTPDNFGRVEPAVGNTLGDGTVTGLFTAPASDRDAPAQIDAVSGEVRSRATILMRGARLSVISGDDRLLADGRSRVAITARLSTTDGAPAPGRRIEFSTTAGAIGSFALTDADGFAAVQLTAPDRPDTARITARFGGTIRDSVAVVFLPVIARIVLTTDVASIRADGLDTAVVTARAFDGLERGAAGVRIDLAVDRGALRSSRLVTGNEGFASTVLTGIARTLEDSIRIVAQTAGGAYRDTIYLGLRGITIELSADVDSLPANAIATANLAARVVETSSGNPVTPGRVFFATDRGAVAQSVPLSEDGLATTAYTAGGQPGRAMIRARYGNTLEDTVYVQLIDRAAAIQLTVTPGSILASGLAAADVAARITDPWGGGAPDEVVTIEFDGPGVVSPNVGRTDRDGFLRARATGTPSTADGRLGIVATSRDGRLRSAGVVALRGVTLEASAEPRLITGDGRSTSTVLASVRETTSGHPVTGDTLRFTTTAGVIAPFARLGEGGEASVQLRSANRPAVASVGVFYGPEGTTLAETLVVAFAGRFSYLDASAGAASLLADGVDSTSISAVVRDTLGRPVEGVPVTFGILSGGSLSRDTASTGGSGQATVFARGVASVSDTSLVVRAIAGDLADTVAVALQGLTLSLESAPDSIPANGRAVALMTARLVLTTGGNPVGGKSVRFTTDAGQIAGTAVLSEEGEATVPLRAAASPGTANVDVSYGRTLTTRRSVRFVPVVGTLTLTAEESGLLGDGLDSVALAARVVDAVGNPAANIRVTFAAPAGGTVSPASVLSDGDGFARTTFRGFASSVDTTLAVEATAGGGAADAIELDQLGVTLRLTATPGALPANGRATAVVRAHLIETTRNVALIGRTVGFAADRGLIGREALTDSTGSARVAFTSPPSPGSAQLRATYGGLADSTTVECLASLPATAAIEIAPRLISITGSGRRETADLIVTVRDAGGSLVPDGTQLVLREATRLGLTFAGGADTFAATTDNGIAQTTVRAGDRSGQASIAVYYEGRLLASGGNLEIEAGPSARVVVRPDLNTIHRPAGGTTAIPVTAVVSDRAGNPVIDSTVVRFSLNPDTLAQITGTGYTRGGVVLTPIDPIDYPNGVWLTYANDRAGRQVWISALSGEVRDSSRAVLPGDLQGGEPARIEIAVADAILVADGNASTEITLRLFDADGAPVADLTEIRLSAQLGTVVSPRFTAGGVATAIYRAGRVTGFDTIRVVSGEVSDRVVIRLRPGAPFRLTLESDRDTLRANGIDNTTLRAQVFDRFDNPLGAGENVSFSASRGEVTALVQTDQEGRAVSRLTSALETGRSLVRASTGDATASLEVLFVSGTANNIVFVSADRSSIGVRGSGSPETAALLFEVRDDRGVPVDSLSPATVRFSLEGPDSLVDPDVVGADAVAYLQPDSISTDGLGRVAVTVRSGFYAGAVQITASTGANIAGRAISVAIHGGPPDGTHFAVLNDRCSVTGILGTPPDTVIIDVVLGDRFSNPVTPGTVVRFRATGGVITGSAATDSSGLARAILRTTAPEPVGGVDTITAQTIDWQNREVSSRTIVLVTGPTLARFDTSDGWSIPAGGFRDFVLTVADSFRHPLTAGTTIEIGVQGENPQGEAVQGLALTGEAVGEPVTLVECGGVTTFRVRLFNYVGGIDATTITLTATITSANGDRVAFLEGTGLPQVIDAARSRVVLTPTEIVADGAEESQVAITLYDSRGIAIPNVPPDRVAVSVVGGDALVTQPAAATTQSGQTSAAIVGRSVGEGRVEVRAGGTLLDQQPILTFVAGPPANIAATLGRRQLTVGGDTTRIVIDVTDANGNPATDGTSVRFEAPDGSFDPASTVTVSGQAATVLSSGTTAGAAQFTVQASRRGGTISTTIANLTYLAGEPYSVSVSAASYSLAAATATPITIRITDEFGNPVEEGTEVALSIDPAGRGSIAPGETVADSTGSAAATYTAGTVAGQTARVVAAAGDTSGRSSPITFLPGDPGQIDISADPAQVAAGGSVDIVTDIFDVYGNRVADDTRVLFAVEPDEGVLSPSAVRTRNGSASSRFSGATEAGDYAVSASAGDAANAVQVTITAGPVAAIAVEANPAALQFGRIGTVTATATDQYGNPVSGVTLGFSITTNPGGCSLQHASRVTNAAGVAFTLFTAGNSAGSAIVTVICDIDGDGDTDVDGIVIISVDQ